MYFATFSVISEKVDFTDHKVFGIFVKNDAQLKVLQKLQNEFVFFEDPVKVGAKYQMVVPPNKLKDFDLNMIGMDFTLDITNLQELIDLELIPAKAKNADYEFWTTYHPLSEIQGWVRNISAQFPQVANVVEIGRSYENRPIIALEIINNVNFKAVLIECHIHAREWITSAVTTYIINEMFTSSDPNVREVADTMNWYIIPNINPDGYEFSRNTNRLWRKTRRPNSGSTCIGTDANRNLDFAWGCKLVLKDYKTHI